MANNKSQKKRIRQDEKKREKNAGIRSQIRTSAKKIIKAVASKEDLDTNAIKELHLKFIKIVDTATTKGVVHKKTASRKKSRMAKKVNSVLQQA